MASKNDRVLLDQIIDEQMKSYGVTDRSTFFEVFTASEILKDRDLSNDEIDEGITGKGGDGGIDAIFSFLNGELIIDEGDIDRLSGQRELSVELVVIQAKTEESYRENAIKIILSAILDLFDLERNLSDFRTKYNAELVSAFEIFRTVLKRTSSKFPKISVRYIYSARAIEDPHPNVKSESEKLLEKTKEMISGATSTFSFVGCLDLLEMARRKPITSYGLKVTEAIAAEGGGYVCLVKMNDFMNLLKDEKGNLRKAFFEQNVRDYEGNVEVNAAIRKGLEARGKEDFWWLNNGITIIGSKASLAGKLLTIEDVQIVNGQQTSTEIFKFLSSPGASTGEVRSVLIRVLVSNDAEARDNIIKATNSQTSIKVAQLRATDKIHRDIEEFFIKHNLFYDRRKNHYRNLGKPLKDIVGIPFLAQGLTAVMSRKPHEARAKPSSLLKDGARYDEIFDDKMPLEVFLNVARITRAVDKAIRKKRTLNGYRDIFFHTALFYVGKSLGKTVFSFQDLADFKTDSLSEEAIDSAFNVVYERMQATASSSGKTITQLAKNSDSSSQVMALLGEEIEKSKAVKAQP